MLKRIETIVDFALFVPEICRMHDVFANKWDKESDQDGFLSELVSNFSSKSWFFGSLDETGKMEYFIVLYDLGQNCQFRAFYVDKQKHELTKVLIQEIREIIKDRNFKNCYFTTTRITKSYDRWVRKLGAKPCEITYNVNL